MLAHRGTSMAIETDVLAAQGGDQQAFTRLVETTCTLVSSIALAIVRDPDLSRDISQDVFLSAWRDIRKLREPTSFLPWLRQVTRHRAYHIQRGLRRARLRTVESETDDLLETVVDARPDAHQRLVSLETRRLVADTIERLPEDAREVVTLYYREGRSITQVANLLGLSEPAVRQRLSRARASLRDDLLERAGEGLVASAPGAAFVAGVAAALTVGAPAAAAAATVGITGLKTGSLIGKLAVLVGGAAVGVAGGVAGIVLGLRMQRRQVRSEEERQGLRRVQTAAVAAVVAAAVGLTLARRLTHGYWCPLTVFYAYMVSLAVIYEGWLPRILRPRFEAEMREDPVSATRRRRRERNWRLAVWIVVLLLGTAAVLTAVRISSPR